MDIPKEITESAPVMGDTQEQSVSKGVESTPIAEFVQTSPAQPNPVIPAQAGIQTIDTGSVVLTQDDDKVTSEDVADLTSSGVMPIDDNWVDRVKEVIKEDEGKPYKEEKDAEKLNEDYMKSRFNVDVDAPVEEKN